jgi:sulfate adenylyltransferase subunit 1
MEHSNIVRFTTAGSVDDGKSTLIGRLLYDSKSVYTDQMENIIASSEKKGNQQIDFSLLTDGLKDERTQGITIDVAYRYFSTPKRKFIIADTPGHIQYTRNMITGASTANAALILIDARKGVVEQTRRHTYIATLLNIPHLLVCINKMDLMEYNEETFENIKADFEILTAQFNRHHIQYIPISALHGDNVVDRSVNMAWYKGLPLLETLESLNIEHQESKTAARFFVQTIIRPHSTEFHDFRGYAGRIDGGEFSVGDEIVILPSNQTAKIKEIYCGSKQLNVAVSPLSVTFTLDRELDISRGDLFAKSTEMPNESNEILATMCWFNERYLNLKTTYIFRIGTRTLRCKISEILHLMDVHTMNQIPLEENESQITLNDIFRAKLKLNETLFYDVYTENRQTGSFILVDPITNETVAVGMIS